MPDAARDLAIVELLDELGFATAHAAARKLLEDHGLTNPRKHRIAASKRDAVRDLLAATFVRTCTRAGCRARAAHDGRALIEVADPRDCELCGGQQNRAQVDRAIAALEAAGRRHLVVVGGSPATREELARLIGDRLDVRLISGTDRRTGEAARADLAWADLVVVWGATELDHTVSKLYTDARKHHVVTCGRRGIAALAATVLEALARRR